MKDRRRVMIKVSGTQLDEAGEKNKIVTQAEGQYVFRGGKHYVLYDDNELHDEQTIATVLKFNQSELNLLRRGAVKSEQRFVIGKQHESLYRTPYGDLSIGTCTQQLQVDYDAVSGGQIKIVYDMLVNGKLQSHNTLDIQITMLAAGRH